MITISGMQQQMADLEKRRKHRAREPITPAHAADEAALEAQCGPDGHCDSKPVTGEDARKAAIPGIEAEPGPGTSTQPGQIKPEDFRRPYVEAGHAARSPLAQPPRESPLPPAERGVVTPVQLPGMPVLAGHNGPIVQAMAAHQARAIPSRPPARGQQT